MNLPNFVNPLLRRAFMCLEDAAWNDANGLLEQVLNQEPENAYAYLGKLFVKLRVRNYAELEAQTEAFDVYNEYNNCIRFADTELANYLQWLVASIKYNKASDVLNSGSKEVADYENAAQLFHEIAGNFDADAKEKLCYEKINEIQEQDEARKKRKRRFLKKFFIITAIAVIMISMMIIIYPFVHKKYLNIEDWYLQVPIKEANVGKLVKFGKYGGEEIIWEVLDIKDGQALLLSKYGVGAKPFKNKKIIVFWDTCTLREWMNNDFYNEAFSNEEQQKIMMTKVMAEKNPKYKLYAGRDTMDKVFLLNIQEVNKYFRNDGARVCYLRELREDYPSLGFSYSILDFFRYFSVRGWIYRNVASYWWLRSPGKFSDATAIVSLDGTYSYSSGTYSKVVRPAMWVKIE